MGPAEPTIRRLTAVIISTLVDTRRKSPSRLSKRRRCTSCHTLPNRRPNSCSSSFVVAIRRPNSVKIVVPARRRLLAGAEPSRTQPNTIIFSISRLSLSWELNRGLITLLMEHLEWKFYMETLLTKKQLLLVVNGTERHPGGGEGTKRVHDFYRKQAEACVEIILHVSPSQLQVRNQTRNTDKQRFFSARKILDALL